MSYERTCAAMRLDEMIELPKSALVIYLHLLQLNRSSGKNGTLFLSDSQLQTRTHLSQQSITDAKRILKNKGFIDFQTRKGSTTRYQIPLYHTLNQLEYSVENQAVHQLEDFKNPNIKNKKLLPPPPALPAQPVRAIGAEVEELTEKLRQITEATRALESRLLALKASEGEHSPQRFDEAEVVYSPRSLARSSDEGDDALEAVIAEWGRRPKFAPLDFPQITLLQKYLRCYSVADLKAAMDTASLTNKATGKYNGVSFAYFQEVLERMDRPKKPKPTKARPKKPKPTKAKGEDKNDGVSYSAPRRSGNEPWRKYTDEPGDASGDRTGDASDSA